MKAVGLEVTIHVTNIGTQGYPGTGKTSTLNLITGEVSDGTRESTGFFESASRRIYMQAAKASTVWEKVTTDRMSELVCEAMKVKIDLQNQQKEDQQKEAQQKEAQQKETQPKDAQQKVVQSGVQQKDTQQKPAQNKDAQSSNNKQSSIKDEDTPSKRSSSLPHSEPAMVTSTSLKQHSSSSTQVHDNVTTQSFASSPQQNNKSLDPYSAFPDLLRQLNNIKGSGVIFESHWMVVTDCGGQPPFLDAAALFVRNRCLQLFPVKLNERLDQPPTFSYYLNGKLVSLEDIVIHPQTNLHVLETLAKSVAGIHSTGTHSGSDSHKGSKFITVGTFYDDIKSCDETVEMKQTTLKDVLEPYKLIHVYDDGNPIVPINATTNDEDKQKEFATKLRKLIELSETAIKYKVKLCYFILLLSMNKMSETENKAILHIDDCIQLGQSLHMDKSETREAIQFFHNIGRIMYFDDACPSSDLQLYVIVDDVPVLKRVSRLLSVSFIRRDCVDDDYSDCKGLFSQESCSVSEKKCLSDGTQKQLQHYGEFERKELAFLKLTEMELDFFLSMLEHVKAIAKKNTCSEKSSENSSEKYFMPCALQFATDNVKKEILSGIFEYVWAIKFQRIDGRKPHIPVPVGYLPALVVILVTDFSPDFSTVDKRQYRNCVTLRYKEIGNVYIVECHMELEVYFSGCRRKDCTNDCSVIREFVLEAMKKTDKRLRIDKFSIKKIDCFLCSCGKGSSRHLCTYTGSSNVECEENQNEPLKLNDMQKIWINPSMHASKKLLHAHNIIHAHKYSYLAQSRDCNFVYDFS